MERFGMQPFVDQNLSRNARVLLVDDDPAMRRLLCHWLEQAGYRVEQASDGEQALAAIQSQCPEFLVTDWEMPHLDGLELCRRVRELNLPHYVYILFLTVKSRPDETVAGLEGGADDFLPKPISQAEILARMRAGSRVLELESRLSLAADTDALTGLASRRRFFRDLEEQWQRAQRLGRPMSCVMMDVDFFKRINDIHGHVIGDSVLKTVADLLAADGKGLVCRYGGEEFCAMLPETGEAEAAVWAEEARKRISGAAIAVAGKELRLTCSFGTAQNHDDTQTCEQLVDQADQALLCAKRSGRDRVVRFESLADTGELELEGDGRHESLFHGIAARHVMTPVVVCLREEETVGQAAEFFLRSRINSTPVVDGAGRLVGILSEKDLMAAMVSLECWNRPIREVMKPNVIYYDEDTPIRVIYEFLCRVSIRRVVVVDEGRPTGTISRGTLLRWFRNLVVTKGLVDASAGLGAAPEVDPYRSKHRLAETSHALATQVACLEDYLRANPGDLAAHVVGGVTRMQELLDDLLAYSRYADHDSGDLATLRSILLNSTHVD